MIEILNPDLTPIDNAEIPALEAGQDSGAVPFTLRNTGPDAADLLIVLQVQDPVTGLWLSSGLPPADELWARLRITGQDVTNAPAQQLEIHDWTPAGAGRGLPVASLLTGGLRTGEIRFRPPATASSLTWTFRLAVIAAESSIPIQPGARTGILTGLGDRGYNALLRGFAITPSAPADAYVHATPGQLVHRGRLVGLVPPSIELTQQDGAGDELGDGEAYLAVLSAGAAGITVTKGLRAAAPTRPAPPPWEPVLAVVEVLAGPTTTIEAAHITDLRIFDRYHAEPGPGLQLRVHAGRAIAGGTLRYHGQPVGLVLPPNQTTWLWQRASGAWEVTPEGAPPPETTALGPLWIATTDATGVTELSDRRTFAADLVVIPLRGNLPGAPGPIASTLAAGDGLVLEALLWRLSDHGSGSAGRTQLDLLVDGVTIFPSAAVSDQRPAWSFDASALNLQGGVHEVNELLPGQVIELVSTEHPAGGTPAWAEAFLLCRRCPSAA